MGVDSHFWTTYTYVYIYIGIWVMYTYVALLIGANNCEDNCACVANNNCEGDIHIVAFTIGGPLDIVACTWHACARARVTTHARVPYIMHSHSR